MTDTAPAAYTPMDDHGRANVQSIIDALTTTGEAIGSWESTINAREQGATLIMKFERKAGVNIAVELVSQLEQAPAMLADACRKLLAADAVLAEQAHVIDLIERDGWAEKRLVVLNVSNRVRRIYRNASRRWGKEVAHFVAVGAVLATGEGNAMVGRAGADVKGALAHLDRRG